MLTLSLSLCGYSNRDSLVCRESQWPSRELNSKTRLSVMSLLSVQHNAKAHIGLLSLQWLVYSKTVYTCGVLYVDPC